MDREAPTPSPVRGWDEQLRACGYRVTPQRQLVLEAVARLDHGTPEEIGAQVRKTARGVNISTIYRTLELLEQIGMVTHTHLEHGAPSYHLAADAHHVHLKCRVCGRVTEVGPDAIRPLITMLEERHGFETDVGHLTVFGRCADCRTAREPKRRGPAWTAPVPPDPPQGRGTSDEGPPPQAAMPARRGLRGAAEASGKAGTADA